MSENKYHGDPDGKIAAEQVAEMIRLQSEGAMSEPQAPQGSLRCDGVVGLRADEADALSQEWMGRSLKCAARSREDSAAGRETLAWCNEVRSATYLLCADELRQHAGLPIPRQPEPNIPVRHGGAEPRSCL